MYRKKKERRHGPDCLQYVLTAMAILAWSSLLMSILAFHYARPEVEYGLLRYFDIDVRKEWHREFLPLFLYPLWTCCGITLLSVLMNLRRSRRFEDNQLSHLLLLLLISVTSLVGYYFMQQG